MEVYEVGLLTVLEKAKKELDEEKKRKRQAAHRKNFKIAEVVDLTDKPDNCYACSKGLTCRNPYCDLKPEPVMPPVIYSKAKRTKSKGTILLPEKK